MGELIFVGLGMSRPEDMSVRALTVLRNCDEIFAEFYTSKLNDASPKELEAFIGKKITVLKRADVEEKGIIVEAARKGKVAFISAGDPMSATTHVDLRLRAIEQGVSTDIINGVSIFISCSSALGLQPYKFGRTVTIPFPEPRFLPSSPYDNILENYSRGLHTLILLDIKEEEGRYMTAPMAMRWLLDAEERLGKGLVKERSLFCAAARVGSARQALFAGYPDEVKAVDLGPPLHCMVMPGRLHFMEARALVTLANAPRDILEDQGA
ncbi:MAG: diphthine synthase [Methanomassiliicoccus sp.]|nr:diphthine synthase [Methanomassiliicoccus sp.]